MKYERATGEPIDPRFDRLAENARAQGYRHPPADWIAIDPLGDRETPLHNPKHDHSPAMWAEGVWCASMLSPDIHVRVGWDGLINRAYNNADPEPSGHWIAES